MADMDNRDTGLERGVSVVIPVYNSATGLAGLADRVVPALSGLGRSWEVIFVDDGSRDSSWTVLEGLAQANQSFRAVRLMRNYGQHNALLLGVRLARFDTLVTMDDDLQNPPEEIPKLLGALTEQKDVVYGTPANQRHGVLRDLASVITKWVLQSAAGADTARHVSAFRAFRTCVREAFREYEGPFVSLDVLLTWGSTRFGWVAVNHDPRRFGRSNYTFFMLLRHTLNMMTGFSTVPLQLASMLGFALTLFGAGVLFYVVGRYLLEGGSVPGFPFLASLVSVFSGAQMFALGIMGEYLARVHFRMMGRPTYAVRDRVGPKESD